ncbi:MAG: hypothetical protein CL827_02165 [Crocinitomicaceae bacterium]|nr:hypothetical protein [Crocinitomicaceae bacterium]
MKSIYKFSSVFLVMLLFLSSCSKEGCTDPIAENYDAEAKKDDGTCEFIMGCMDENSIAYNSLATKDDGSCVYPENTKRSLVLKATGTWCPPCGDWGAEYVNNIYNDFPGSAEVIGLHSNDNFSVDIGYNLLSILNNSAVPSFYLGLNPMGNSGYANVSNLISTELSSTNQVSMAVSYTVANGIMNIKVQSRLENQFIGDNCYLAMYIMEDGQIAPQEVSGIGTVSDYVHDHILRTEANGSTFGIPISFTNGENLTEVSAILAPSPIWNHDNLYLVAVIWQQNGSSYDFINLIR